MQKSLFIRFILNDMEHKKLFYDSKTILQEIVQAKYSESTDAIDLLKEEGPDHNKSFKVSCTYRQERIRNRYAAVQRKRQSRMRHTRQF